MSALDTLINATSGLIIHLPLTDASGAATPAKAGPSSGSLTTSWGAGAVIGATAFLPDDAFAAQFPNVVNAFARITSDALILSAGDFAVEGFFQPDSAAVNATLMGNAHILVSIGSAGTMSMQAYDSANTQFSATTPVLTHTYSANDILHLVAQRSGGRVRIYVNGMIGRTTGNMSLATRNTSSNFTVGGSSLGLGFKAAHVAYYSRPLTPGEIRARADLAGIVPGIDGLVDRTSNLRGRAVALGTTIYDSGSGYRLSSTEEHVLRAANGLTYHPSTLAAGKPDVSTAVLTDSSTQAEVCAAAGRLVLEMLSVWTLRRQTTDLNYQASTGELITPTAGDNSWFADIAVARAAAVLHRYGGGGRNSWAYQIASRYFDWLINSKQQTSGAQSGRIGDSTTGAANYFVLDDLCITYLALYPALPQSVRDRWKAALVAAGEYNVSAEGLWYTNGNIEIGTAIDWWLMYQVTGNPVWLDRMETQLAWAASPPAGVLGTPSGGGTFGWVETVTPTLTDGRDGAGYFKETNGSNAPGLDFNYSAAQGGLCATMYRLSGDNRFLRYANMCWNTTEGMGQGGTSRWTKNTGSEWMLNGTGSTRVTSATIAADNPLPMLLAYKGGRTALNADAAGMIRSLEFMSRANYAAEGVGVNWLGSAVAEAMCCATDYPDIRLR